MFFYNKILNIPNKYKDETKMCIYRLREIEKSYR
jgi:hypothetical protein